MHIHEAQPIANINSMEPNCAEGIRHVADAFNRDFSLEGSFVSTGGQKCCYPQNRCRRGFQKNRGAHI